jgi:hypothetical protein
MNIDEAQAYGDAFVGWLDKNREAAKTSDEQDAFLALTLTKMTLENPMLLGCRRELGLLITGVYALGYRAGWEAATTKALLG